MNLGNSKLPWIIMALIMALMLTRGFSDYNIMLVVMLAVMATVMLFWMKTRKAEP